MDEKKGGREREGKLRWRLHHPWMKRSTALDCNWKRGIYMQIQLRERRKSVATVSARSIKILDQWEAGSGSVGAQSGFAFVLLRFLLIDNGKAAFFNWISSAFLNTTGPAEEVVSQERKEVPIFLHWADVSVTPFPFLFFSYAIHKLISGRNRFVSSFFLVWSSLL
jgi:hypothetical protein